MFQGDGITQAGDTVGIDQLISAQPGLVPQENDILKRARMWAVTVTVFVGDVIGYAHMGLMADQSCDSTLQAKHDFEHLSKTRDMGIKHCHADNG